ncbi:hypothetical protein BUALT_Bualt07G0175300 [Buddleja alternifolia]|uniref:ATP synthase subunit f, mitochondrial n=1 Tax=Buddleja alternifolia TaxID=168488 RepID=A0AAV6XIB0_9LAMI|nr:hypothetical protein BUALT_Bualt07G0175300 [Buddleja alternifolia]
MASCRSSVSLAAVSSAELSGEATDDASWRRKDCGALIRISLDLNSIPNHHRQREKGLKKGKMAMRTFYNEIKGMKVKELPGHLKPMFSMDYVKNSVKRGLDNYHAKYIETSSVDPLYHICFGGMIFSYLVALPEERRHLQHQQQHAAH